MKSHPAADMFPMMSDPELKELAADIKFNGQGEPIVVLNGLILDGRNREKACIIAGIEPRTAEYSGDDPYSFVLTKNIHRRHLTPKERAGIVIKLKPELMKEAEARQKVGKAQTRTSNDVQVPRQHDPERNTNAALAKVAGVGEATVARAAKAAGVSKPRKQSSLDAYSERQEAKAAEERAEEQAKEQARQRQEEKQRREEMKRPEHAAMSVADGVLDIHTSVESLEELEGLVVDWPGVFKTWEAREIVRAYDMLPEALAKLEKFCQQIKPYVTAWREAHPEQQENEVPAENLAPVLEAVH